MNVDVFVQTKINRLVDLLVLNKKLEPILDDLSDVADNNSDLAEEINLTRNSIASLSVKLNREILNCLNELEEE